MCADVWRKWYYSCNLRFKKRGYTSKGNHSDLNAFVSFFKGGQILFLKDSPLQKGIHKPGKAREITLLLECICIPFQRWPFFFLLREAPSTFPPPPSPTLSLHSKRDSYQGSIFSLAEWFLLILMGSKYLQLRILSFWCVSIPLKGNEYIKQFSNISYKGDHFCNFPFTFLYTKSLLKRVHYKRGEFVNSFLLD